MEQNSDPPRGHPYLSGGADGKAHDILSAGLRATEEQHRFDGVNPFGNHCGETYRARKEAFDNLRPGGARSPDTRALALGESPEIIDDAVAGYFGARPIAPGRDHEQATVGERPEDFRAACDRQGGVNAGRFPFFGSGAGVEDRSRFQCRIACLEPGSARVVRHGIAGFDPGEEHSTARLQVAPPGRFNAAANRNPCLDPEAMRVISDHRYGIIELREEVGQREEAMAAMPDAKNMNSGKVRTNTGNIRALNSRADTCADDIGKNRAGIAHARAFPSSG